MLHIENGMQQEAVYLACQAQGVGTCIDNQGINGTEYGEKIATASHLIMEIADPYESACIPGVFDFSQQIFYHLSYLLFLGSGGKIQVMCC